MSTGKKLIIKLIHCGNRNIANVEDTLEKNVFFMPMGLIALSNILNEADFCTEIIHLDLEAHEKIHEILNFSEIDAIGFDLHWINQALNVIQTIELIKSLRKDIFIFLGGFSASLFAEEIIDKNNCIDAIIKGDAEIPIVELAHILNKHIGKYKELKESDYLKGVQNLVWKPASGKIVVNEHTYVSTTLQLDQFNYTEFKSVRSWDKYVMLSKLHTTFIELCQHSMFFIEPGRGCEYACTFCGGNNIAQKKINNRKIPVIRSVEAVFNTIKDAFENGFKIFYCCFEFFNSDEWYLNLMHRISTNKLKLSFCYGSWKLPSKKLIDSLSEACEKVLIEISPESSSEILRKINKDKRLFYTNKELKEILNYIKTKGNIYVQLCFGYFLVNDTERDIESTIEFIINLLIEYDGMLEIEYSNFSTDPGSLVFFNPEKFDMNLSVNCFDGYLKEIHRNYIERKNRSADLTMFFPTVINNEVASMINFKIKLLHYLFANFGKTITFILRKEKKSSIVLSLLENPLKVFSGDTISSSVLLYRIIDVYPDIKHDNTLLLILSSEYTCIKDRFFISKPTEQMSLKSLKGSDLQENDFFHQLISYLNQFHNTNGKGKNLELDFNFS